MEHGAGGFAAVLEFPNHGRARLLFHRIVCGGIRAGEQAGTDEIPGLFVAVSAEPAAAMDRRRTRLDRRRSRAPALGDRGRAADLPRGLQHLGGQCLDHAVRLRGVLFDPRRGRCLPHGQDHKDRAGRRRSRRKPGYPVRHSRSRRITEIIMFDYESMRLIWWALLGILLIGFAVTDGFDLGVAVLLPYVARTDVERRIAINTVGPVWEGNQVWLILGGGAIFAAWPMVYATAFSGFYLAMFLVLAALILRPVAFKFRSKLENARWRATWDACLFVSGLVPALIFGVAFGNVI